MAADQHSGLLYPDLMLETKTHNRPRVTPGASLRTNFLWLFTGNALFCVCQWAILVAFAKLTGPAMLGQFALGLSIASPILTFTNLQLKVVQTTDTSGAYRFADYFGLRLITTGAGLAAIVSVALFGRFGAETAAVIVAVGLAKAVESLTDLLYGQFQRREAMKRVAVSMILRGLTSLVALGVALYLTRRVLWGAIAMIASGALVWLGHDFRWGARLLKRDPVEAGGRDGAAPSRVMWPRWRARAIVPLVRLSFPLGVVMVMVALNQNVPRYFVAYHLGEADLGIFSAMAYTMVAMTAIGEAMGVAATPKLSRYFASGEHGRFGSLVLKLNLQVAALGAAGIVAAKLGGGALLALIYTPAFAAHAKEFTWLMVAAAAMAVACLLSSAVSAARRFTIQVPMFLAVLLMSAVGCHLLVPRYGMPGAAVAVALSNLVHILIASAMLVWVLVSARRPKTGYALAPGAVSGIQEA